MNSQNVQVLKPGSHPYKWIVILFLAFLMVLGLTYGSIEELVSWEVLVGPIVLFSTLAIGISATRIYVSSGSIGVRPFLWITRYVRFDEIEYSRLVLLGKLPLAIQVFTNGRRMAKLTIRLTPFRRRDIENLIDLPGLNLRGERSSEKRAKF